jgi:hypothetical protein
MSRKLTVFLRVIFHGKLTEIAQDDFSIHQAEEARGKNSDICDNT